MVMQNFKAYYPNWVDSETPSVVQFVDIDDLISKCKHVRDWITDPNFSHFAKISSERQPKLMAILEGGNHWWVVGFIEKPEELDLPEWTGGK